MPVQSLVTTTVNPDLQKERDAAEFIVEEFAIWWHGGEDKLKFKRDLENFMLDDYVDHGHLLHYLSHEEMYEISVMQSYHVAKKLKKFQEMRNPGGNDIWPTLFSSTISWTMVPLGNPNEAQFLLLLACLKYQCTDEQYEKFYKRVENYEIGAAFAQTELGHGTFVRGIETRADYDRSSKAFILNTPTITSYKWWAGGLGHSANYAVVVAQLFIDNESKGVEMFWVQLRDEDTHMPLPGVDIGDIGQKIGLLAINNGFLGLKNVHIPRENMLMRNAEVLPDGTFIKRSDPVLTYFGLIYGRVFTARNVWSFLGRSVVTATRYSTVRRQCPINSNESEVQIIDHVTQQIKLFPEIATLVAVKIAAEHLNTMYETTLKDLYNNDSKRLSETHAFSCVMKAVITADCSAGVERLRLACGGHGYLVSSNLGSHYVDAVAFCTVEGENTVLLLQAGRFLLKSWRNAISGTALPSTISYLADFIRQSDFGQWLPTRNNIIKAMQYATANKIRLAFSSFEKRINTGQTTAEAANATGIELQQAAELYGRTIICSTFFTEVIGPNARNRSASLNKVLENLLDLHLVQTALNHMSNILRVVNLTDSDLCYLQSWLEQSLAQIRPNAVAICDGFDLNDIALNSTLGCYDGNVYERLFTSAKQSPLNKQSVRQIFYDHMRPFFKSNM